MSDVSSIIDAVLAHVGAAVAGVTTRNALTAGYIAFDAVPPDQRPFAQAFAGSVISEPIGVVNQFNRTTTFSVILLRDPDQGEQAWIDLEAIRAALRADLTLGGLVDRYTEGLTAVDEVTDRDRTLGRIDVSHEKVA